MAHVNGNNDYVRNDFIEEFFSGDYYASIDDEYHRVMYDDDELIDNGILKEKKWDEYEVQETKHDDTFLNILYTKLNTNVDLPIQDMFNTEIRSYRILNILHGKLNIPNEIKDLIVNFCIDFNDDYVPKLIDYQFYENNMIDV